MCADKLANLGANQDEPLVVMEDAPDDVKSFGKRVSKILDL